ncbi:MAG: LUD domain-containing protein [Solirubrobacterales bacterium]|nr:LUD domain-containing protein [Solirubrobacterales bacterium]
MRPAIEAREPPPARGERRPDEPDDPRRVILERIELALGSEAGKERVEVPRAYSTSSELSASEALERFVERVADYEAGVHRVAGDAVAATVAELCERHDARRLAIPAELDPRWVPSSIEVVVDERLPNAELDALDGALTGCALAIAETGTIALDAGPRSGRRALTLVPDLHICVIEAAQIGASVPEGIAGLAEAASDGRPITFVSGPSATSDIELSRVEGVHGPRRLEVVVVE